MKTNVCNQIFGSLWDGRQSLTTTRHTAVHRGTSMMVTVVLSVIAVCFMTAGSFSLQLERILKSPLNRHILVESLENQCTLLQVCLVIGRCIIWYIYVADQTYIVYYTYCTFFYSTNYHLISHIELILLTLSGA
jgi:hypothetical protein